MGRKHSVINMKNMHRTLPAVYGVVLKYRNAELSQYVCEHENNIMRGFVGSMFGMNQNLLYGCLRMSNWDSHTLKGLVASKVERMVNGTLSRASSMCGLPFTYYHCSPYSVDLCVDTFIDVKEPRLCTRASLTMESGLVALRGAGSTMFIATVETAKSELGKHLVRGIPEIVLMYMYTYKLNV